MLAMPSNFSQARAYSSDSKDDPAAGGNGFGFQSLGSLFPPSPAPGRYSQPKERRAEEKQEAVPSTVHQERATGEVSQKDASRKPAVEAPFFGSVSTPEHSDGASELGNFFRLRLGKDGQASSSAAETPSGSRLGRDRSAVAPTTKRPQKAAKKSRKSAARNPLAKIGHKVAPPKDATESQLSKEAWGLSHEDHDTTEPTSSPSTSDTTTTTPTTPQLTHVRPTGEAHMVDVGSKPATKRTAIAIANVPVSKRVYAAIEANTLAKGDVLSTARIAGIMAAKRTSDLIPLCHPIPITKITLDAYLVPNNRISSFWRASGRLVALQATVETVGPTGVEMEALVAVQGAGLTVVDMCKGMEKGLMIDGARVVYKAGGRSGVWVDDRWRDEVGSEKFEGGRGPLLGEEGLLIRGRKK